MNFALKIFSKTTDSIIKGQGLKYSGEYMRHTLFVAEALSKRASYRKAFSRIEGWHFHSAKNVLKTLRQILSHSIDTIIFDLESPVKGMMKLIQFLSHKFPGMYRIVFRSHHYQVKHRRYLEQAHSSFTPPKNLLGIRHILDRLDRFYPAKVEKKSILEEKQRPAIQNNLFALYDAVSHSGCTIGQILDAVYSNEVLGQMLLKRINSSHYALRKPCTTPERAVRLMGVLGVKELLEERFGKILENEVVPLAKVA